MSTSNSDPEPKEPTLYDPSDERTESIDNTSSEEELEEELELELPEELAQRLLEVAVHLGLNPSVVASRAIDMICEEVGLIEEEDLTSNTLIKKYQTRLDLLHTLDLDVEEEESDEGEERDEWAAVDEIIETGEQSR